MCLESQKNQKREKLALYAHIVSRAKFKRADNQRQRERESDRDTRRQDNEVGYWRAKPYSM